MDWKDSLRVRKWVPKDGDKFFTPSITESDLAVSYHFVDDSGFDKRLLDRGLIFRTKEEAISCAQKMLEAVKKG